MGRHLRHLALLLLGSALGAFTAVPAFHAIGHQDDHVHIGGATVLLDDLDEHEHRDDEDAPSPLDHGAGSLAHFGAVSLEATSEIQVEPIVSIGEPSLLIEPSHPHRPTSTRRARDPPAH